ncbi:PREDICTED: TBC1 domain family member 7 [Nicrophorus vespilloides]|uniref:TBC1 domain family member 7 n=1 Tax=Nicrophorus vespilloides TaxID=110193 RepID=A0ABM1MB92_NICVS|nr:PREDICTED: TBC1 domain family member 7 [Nicrophorus vespilloides]
MATHDDRNFRSTYYEKVGCRSVEEKKSLDILLKEKPLDKVKLKQFCLRFSVPSAYRNIVWKLLLDVLPIYVDCHTFIMQQRKEEYSDLYRTLQILRVVDPMIHRPQSFYAMWLLQTGQLHFNTNVMKEHSFVHLVQSFMQFFDDDADIFWLTSFFYNHIQKNKSEYGKLAECTWGFLEREDVALYKHLLKIRGNGELPLEKWFDSCFAGVLNENALGKIWDKICGGSYKIMSFLVVNLFMNQKHRLLKCIDTKAVIECLKNIPEETAELIATKSIDMWQQNGSPLTIYDKPKI